MILSDTTFYPFNAYSFLLQAEKDDGTVQKSGNDQVNVIITEYDIPLLGV
jgi:hypothetical protein